MSGRGRLGVSYFASRFLTTRKRGELEALVYFGAAKWAAATPTCTMRGVSIPATPTYL
jgi:hypothetical protein